MPEPKTYILRRNKMKYKYLFVLGVFLNLCTLAAQDNEVEIPESVRETPVVRAVRKVSNSVVSIKCNIVRQSWFGDFSEEIPRGQGSGVIIDKDGLVVTNYHVVYGLENDPAAKIYVKTYKPPRTYSAKVLTYDIKNDLAVLKIMTNEKVKFDPITLGTSSDLMIGETVIAIGNPLGEEHTVTVGVLSAKGRKIKIVHPSGKIMEFTNLLQTDAAINPGNSGGALVNLTGKLIGINNAIKRYSQGIGYAIPVDTVKRVLDSLIAQDKAGNYWLGMIVKKEDSDLVVEKVVPGGPAWNSGIRKGDKVIRIGSREIKTLKDCTMAFLASEKGNEVPIVVARHGRKKKVYFRAGNSFEKYLYNYLGLVVKTAAVDKKVAEMAYTAADVEFRSYSAVKVLYVAKGSPADEAGLEPGDLMIAFRVYSMFQGAKEIHLPNVRTLLSALAQKERGTYFHFMIYRKGKLYRGSILLP